MNIRRYIYAMALTVVCQPSVVAQTAEDTLESDTLLEDLRINPDMDSCGISAPVRDLSDYPYVDVMANRIEMNDADWSALRRRFGHVTADPREVFTVIHLGDSHIQADMSTAVLRARLAEALDGDSGRGLVCPLRMAGTNEPSDYVFRIDKPVVASTLMRQPWKAGMSFSGVSVVPQDSVFDITLTCKTPFSLVRLFFSGDSGVASVGSVRDHATGVDIGFVDFPVEKGIYLALDSEVSGVDVRIVAEEEGTVVVSAAELRRENGSALCHGIGNNGATFGSYCLIDDFGTGIASLKPDLIVVSLGTNEAFGNISAENFRSDIGRLVGTLREYCPRAGILLTTPSECFRRSYRRTKNRRRRSAQVVNRKIETMRNQILEFGMRNGIPVYDWYEVAGGEGSASRWKADGLLGRDGIHLSAKGYSLSGELLSDAILNALTGND